MIQPGNAGYRNEYKDGEDEMKRNILIYNNQTGIAEKMVPLCAGEDLSVLVAADVEDLYDILHRSEIHLMLVDVELNDKGWDYVTADCNPLELLARIKSQLRRYIQLVNLCANIDRIYKVDELVIDDIQRKVTVEGRNVRLTPIEYKILRLLVQQKGKVFSNSQIYENIWHMQAIGADNTIAVHIRHIREKIEKNPKDPRYLKVVWGNGYKVG